MSKKFERKSAILSSRLCKIKEKYGKMYFFYGKICIYRKNVLILHSKLKQTQINNTSNIKHNENKTTNQHLFSK